MRQLQQELADALQKKSMSEASLEIMSSYWAKLEAETQDFKNNLHQPTSQVCMKLTCQQLICRMKGFRTLIFMVSFLLYFCCK